VSIINFLKDEEGLTVVEYVVGAGMLVVGFAGIFVIFNGLLSDKFESFFD